MIAEAELSGRSVFSLIDGMPEEVEIEARMAYGRVEDADRPEPREDLKWVLTERNAIDRIERISIIGGWRRRD